MMELIKLLFEVEIHAISRQGDDAMVAFGGSLIQVVQAMSEWEPALEDQLVKN